MKMDQVEDGTEPVDHDSALIDIRTLHFLYPEIAVLCQRGGWQAITESALAALVDVKDRFTRKLAGRAARYADLAGRTEIAVPDFVVAYRDIVGAHGLKDLRLYCESISQNTTVDTRLKETEFPFASRTVPETDARSMNTSSDLSSSTSYFNETFSAGKDLPSHFDSDILWPSIGTSSKEINPPKKPDDGIKPSLTTESSLVIRADEEDDSELQVENNLPKQLPPPSLPVASPRQLKSFAVGPDGQVIFLKEAKIPSAKLPTEAKVPKVATKPIQELIASVVQNTVLVEQQPVKHKKTKESKKHISQPTSENKAETLPKFVNSSVVDGPGTSNSESLKIRIKPPAKIEKQNLFTENKESSRKTAQLIQEIKEEHPERHVKSVKITLPVPEKPKLNIKFSKHNFELPPVREETAAHLNSERDKKSKNKKLDKEEEKEMKKEMQRSKERQLEKELEMVVKTKREAYDVPELEVKRQKTKSSAEASPAYYRSRESPRIVTPYHDVPPEPEEKSKKSHKKRKERDQDDVSVSHSGKSKHMKFEPKQDLITQKKHDDVPNESVKKKERIKHDTKVTSVPSTPSQAPSTSSEVSTITPALPKLKLKFGGKNLIQIENTPVKQEVAEPQPSSQTKSIRIVLPPVQAPIVAPGTAVPFPLDMSRKKAAPVQEASSSAPLDLSMSGRVPPPKEVAERLPPREVAERLPPREVAERLPPREVAERLPPKQVAERSPPREAERNQPKESAPVKTQPVKKESKRSMGSHMPSRASMISHAPVKVPTPPPPVAAPIIAKDLLAPVIADDVPLIKVIVQEPQRDKIWICPSCKRPDDGVSEMVGCDGCDEWYHWICVGLTSEPASDKWYCPKCLAKLMAKSKKLKKR